jgi:hypothetical protein
MVIVDFAVDNGKMTIQLQDMPNEANTQNTTIYIGGSPQSAPEEVSPDAQIIRLSLPRTSTQKGFITVTIRMKSGIPERAQSTELYTPKEGDSGTGPSKPDVTSCSPAVEQGKRLTLQGKHMNSINTAFLTDHRITPVIATATTASFTVPANLDPGSYKVGYQGPNVAKTFTRFLVKILKKA